MVDAVSPQLFTSVEAFLESCHVSAAQAYGNFKAVLARLDDPSQRVEARRFLSQIEIALGSVDDALSYYYAQFVDLPLSRGENFDTTGYFAKTHASSSSGDVKGENALDSASDREPSPHRYPDAVEDETSEWSGSLRSVKMLVLPSIFVPENWSFTFYEGLRRAPRAYFANREVVELGTGNGWISIAVAMEACPNKIIGLDINPRAVICARINLYLNALLPDGSPLLGPWSGPPKPSDRGGSSDDDDRAGRGGGAAPRTLLDIVEFHESDLLGWCLQRGLMADTVIGCIPQVINPNPDAMRQTITENQSEEFLYDLGNYCGQEGYVEDQFGLSLIARTLEESVEVLRPSGVTSGHLLLNLGGRPGMAVLEKTFRRRGWHIRKLWQTRVTQATDTDIDSLVKIEEASQRSHVRFQFFMGPLASEPISARTALAYATAGGTITHGLSVFNAHLRHPLMVRSIFRLLKTEGYADASNALDLDFAMSGPTVDYAKFEVADEKIAFLAHLSRAFRRPDSDLKRQITSPDPAGSAHFRSALAAYLRLYYHAPLTGANVCVLPSKVAAMRLVLDIYKPGLALVSAPLAVLLPPAIVRATAGDSFEPSHADAGSSGQTVWLQPQRHATDPSVVLEAPTSSELLVQLIQSLKPQVVICGLSEVEARMPSAFLDVINTSVEVGARLFIDVSDQLELSSTPKPNGLFQHIARHPLPPNVTVFCGLVKDRAYSGIEVGFVLSENETFLAQLTSATSLTYGGTTVLSQVYYHAIIAEMLHFQIDRGAHAPPRALVQEETASPTTLRFIQAHSQAKYALTLGHTSLRKDEAATKSPTAASTSLANDHYHPGGDHQPIEGSLLAASSNALAMPPAILAALFESFARRQVTEAESDPSEEVHQFLELHLGYGCLGEYDAIVAKLGHPASRQQGAVLNLGSTGAGAGSLPRSSVLSRPRSNVHLLTSGTGGLGGGAGSSGIISVLPPVQLVWGGGATSLLSDVFAACAAERGVLVVPPGTPDRILGIAAFAGTAVAGIKGTAGPDASSNARAAPPASSATAVPGASSEGTGAAAMPVSKLSSQKLTADVLDRALAELHGTAPLPGGVPARPRPHHRHRPVWLYLPLPSVPSTGETYTPTEVRALVHTAIRHRTRIVFDTSSLGLGFGSALSTASAPPEASKVGKPLSKAGADRFLLDEYLHGGVVTSVGTLDGDTEAAALGPSSPSSSVSSLDDSAGGVFAQGWSNEGSPTSAGATAASAAASALQCHHAVVVGDVSQLLSTGGLWFGFAVTRDKELAALLRERCASLPHATTQFAMRKVFAGLTNEASALWKSLSSSLSNLAHHATTLADALTAAGWDVLPPSCGLHLVARPSKAVPKGLLSSLAAPVSRLEQAIAASGRDAPPSGLSATLSPLLETGPGSPTSQDGASVVLSSPGVYRFPLSLEEDKFEQLLHALQVKA